MMPGEDQVCWLSETRVYKHWLQWSGQILQILQTLTAPQQWFGQIISLPSLYASLHTLTQHCSAMIAHNIAHATLHPIAHSHWQLHKIIVAALPSTLSDLWQVNVFCQKVSDHIICYYLKKGKFSTTFAISKYSKYSWRQQRFAHIVTLLNKRAVICNVKFNVKQCVMKFVTMCSNVWQYVAICYNV